MKKTLKTFILWTICLLSMAIGTSHVFAETPDKDNLVFIGTEPRQNGYYNHYIDVSQSNLLSDDEALVYVYEANNGNLKSGALKKYQINFSNDTIKRLSIDVFINGEYFGKSPEKFAQRTLDQIPFYEQIRGHFSNLRSVTNMSNTTPAVASKSLQFNATNVYFSTSQKNTLVVEGTFINSGDKQISTIDPIVMNVSVLTNDGWNTTRATFQNIQINLPPGGNINWVFYLHNTSYINFSKWKVTSDYWY